VRSNPWLTASAILAVAVTAGCGNRYRPVITPVPPTGPASQPTAYAVVLSQPAQTTAASATYPCPASLYASPGVATVIDFSGDSVLAQANIGTGPLGFTLDPSGTLSYSLNCDGTINTFPVSSSLQSNQIQTTTLFRDATPPPNAPPSFRSIQSNILVRTTGQYVVNQVRGTVGALAAAAAGNLALLTEISVAPALTAITGASTGQRVFAISQGASTGPGASVTWGQCAVPSSVTTAGEADGIETTTNSVSSQIPLGICPVYGITNASGLRSFVLNRGSGTITVINDQLNTLDTQLNSTGTINLSLPNTAASGGAGPVYADYYAQAELLVTANYDSNTVSVINIPLDIYGNDAPGFGTVLATIPVGTHPAAITVLQDGSRAYVANEGDGTVSVISLTSFTVQKTIPVAGHPRTIASTYNNPAGKVYVTSPDSTLLTILRTDTDIVSAQIQLQGFGVDARTATQFAGNTGNQVIASHSPGTGAP
jgi:YVTN family beta-propeller protein